MNDLQVKPEAYLEPKWESMMELFVKIVKRSKKASENNGTFKMKLNWSKSLWLLQHVALLVIYVVKNYSLKDSVAFLFIYLAKNDRLKNSVAFLLIYLTKNYSLNNSKAIYGSRKSGFKVTRICIWGNSFLLTIFYLIATANFLSYIFQQK